MHPLRALPSQLTTRSNFQRQQSAQAATELTSLVVQNVLVGR